MINLPVWTTPVDLYCERLGPAFWAEPVNAATNLAFIVAAVAAFMQWRRQGSGDAAVLALIAVTFVIGVGSFTFHTLATRGAVLLDVIPIAVFIYGYLLLALRRMLGLSWLASVVLLAVFAALNTGVDLIAPRAVLNGSIGYFPALAAMLVVGALLRETPQGSALLTAAAVFMVSLSFRIVDLSICSAFPLGTHFLWHVLNAVVLYILLRGAMTAPRSVEVTT